MIRNSFFRPEFLRLLREAGRAPLSSGGAVTVLCVFSLSCFLIIRLLLMCCRHLLELGQRRRRFAHAACKVTRFNHIYLFRLQSLLNLISITIFVTFDLTDSERMLLAV
jgi:hypothetical protein